MKPTKKTVKRISIIKKVMKSGEIIKVKNKLKSKRNREQDMDDICGLLEKVWIDIMDVDT